MVKIFDTLIYFLLFIIAALLVTGGCVVYVNNGVIEFSQIDTFGWILLFFLFLRRKLFSFSISESLKRYLQLLLRFIDHNNNICIILFLLFYFSTHLLISIFRFQSFNASAYDLSYLDQALWSAINYFSIQPAKILHSSLSVGQTYLGEHFSPILILVSIIYKIYNSVYSLFIFQSLIFSFSGFLVYKLARIKGISKLASTLILFCFLAYQPLRAANIFDFREDNLFVPIFLGAFIAIELKNFVLFWLLMFLSWITKENAAIFTCLIGFWAIRDKQTRVHGLILAFTSMFVFYLVNQKLTPIFSESQTRFSARLGAFGGTPKEFIEFLFLHPLQFFAQLKGIFFQKSILKYFAIVWVPFIFFIKEEPLIASIALFGFCLNVILGISGIGFHYECILIPFLFYLLIVGIKKNESKITSGFVVLTFLLFFGRSPIFAARIFMPTPLDYQRIDILNKVPLEASIATQSALHPHLTHRKSVVLFQGKQNADYIIADLSNGIDLYGTPNLQTDLEKISEKEYDKIFDENNLRIWKKKEP